MKRIIGVMSVLLAATVFAGSGKALAAGGEMESQSRSPEASMSGVVAPVDATTEYGTFEYQEAMETGTLPPGEGRAIDPPAMGISGDQAPVIEVGGLKYRVGIDTP